MREKLTRDELWVLGEASTPPGFMPNEKSVGELALRMRNDGLLWSDESRTFFVATPAGRTALKEASSHAD